MCLVRVLFVGSFSVCVGDLLMGVFGSCCVSGSLSVCVDDLFTGVFDSCSVCWTAECVLMTC